MTAKLCYLAVAVSSAEVFARGKAPGGSSHHSMPARPGGWSAAPRRGRERWAPSAQREFGDGRQVRAGGAVRCGARPATPGDKEHQRIPHSARRSRIASSSRVPA
jgi:hypothetical protein